MSDHSYHRVFKCAPQWIARTFPFLTLGFALLLMAGCCATPCAPGRGLIDAELQTRTAVGLGPSRCGGETTLPADVSLADGITADEAVAVALWNNSAFNATLARLGMARGDLVQAGLLQNPQFQILLPGGSKQLEWTLFLPIDAILLREQRVAMSHREVCRVAQELVQNGLNLVRDVRVAHADLVFAVQRAQLADEAVSLRQRVYDLTSRRLNAGDISELESTTARIDLRQSQADAAGLRHAVPQAEARLRQLMSLGMLNQPLIAVADPSIPVPELDVPALMTHASLSRPDLKAAQLAFEAAQQRASLSRWQWLRMDVVADANSGGEGPSNFGPGFRLDVPLFNRNEGGVLRADWSAYEASQNYYTVRDQVLMDVQTAAAQVQQAADNLAILQTDLLGTLQETVQLAENAYRDGGASYLLVLQTTSQFLDVRARELQLQADLRRALANLDRSVGQHVYAAPAIPLTDAASNSPFAPANEPPFPPSAAFTAALPTEFLEPSFSTTAISQSTERAPDEQLPYTTPSTPVEQSVFRPTISWTALGQSASQDFVVLQTSFDIPVIPPGRSTGRGGFTEPTGPEMR